MQSSGSGTSPSQALLAFRIIGVSLGLGVTFFAGVAWLVLQGRGPAVDPPLDHDLAINVLAGVAVVAVSASILFWRARVAPAIRRGAEAAEAGHIQSAVIISWALVEAPAMLAVAVYFLYGDLAAGIAGVAMMWIALGLTWPKPDWFGTG